MLRFNCPHCDKSLKAPDGADGQTITCPKCGERVRVLTEAIQGPQVEASMPPPLPVPASYPAPPMLEWQPVPKKEHSGLGIASFIIALVVGGLYLLLVVYMILGVARIARDRPEATQPKLSTYLMAGSMAMNCLSCAATPLSLVGLGLGFVAVIAHRDRNNLFSWIGLFGNAVVVVGAAVLYFLAQAA